MTGSSYLHEEAINVMKHTWENAAKIKKYLMTNNSNIKILRTDKIYKSVIIDAQDKKIQLS